MRGSRFLPALFPSSSRARVHPCRVRQHDLIQRRPARRPKARRLPLPRALRRARPPSRPKRRARKRPCASARFAFDPEELTIAVGTTVNFVNADSAAHTVTEGTDGTAVADPIIDEELEQGGSTSYTFDEAGTYDITCKIHPSMQLTITVEP